MKHAWQDVTGWRVVLYLLLAVVVMNAITVCAAPVTQRQIHPCCPARTHNTDEHCGKPGCSMSDPVTGPVVLHRVNPSVCAAVHASVPETHAPGRNAPSAAPRLTSSTELYLTFRQLLI